MKKISAILLLGVLATVTAASAAAQQKGNREYRFWVEYADKKGSTYSILRPWDFLSERALNRRKKAGFGVTLADLPVNSQYVSAVKGTGVRIRLNSRWMNGSLVSTDDSSLAQQIAALGFVSRVSLVGIYNRKRGAAEDDPGMMGHADMPMSVSESAKISIKNKVREEEYNEGYGLGWKQISMIGGQKLHRAGYRGQGIYIAVLDAGFYRANMLESFDSMFAKGRFLGGMDMVDVGGTVFNDDDHGTQVLSCLASNLPGVMVGTAPGASYLLIRTEDSDTETPAEEIQWLCGAEYADSMGVDLISSSLGYTEFDDSRFGHHYAELDGKTTLITRAANMAWERGMIVVNSAGNEGDGAWKYIGAPADAEGVIAVGAVNEYGDLANFSSLGPTADNRIKPDLAALGYRTTIVNSNGYYIRSNGTSYSAPVLAGAIACLLQAGYDLQPARIRKMAMVSGDRYFGADNRKGMGVPDFGLALRMFGKSSGTDGASHPFVFLPAGDTLRGGFDLKSLVKPEKQYRYELRDASGKLQGSGELAETGGLMYGSRIEATPGGHYTLLVKDNGKEWKGSLYIAKDEEK